MALEVIDLISSSPSPDILPVTTSAPKQSSAAIPSSDPFDSFDDGPTITEDRQTKRRKLSSPSRPSVATSPKTANCHLPPFRNAFTRKPGAVVDPIEFTSSPGHVQSSLPDPAQNTKTKTATTSILPSIDSDPFASSPRTTLPPGPHPKQNLALDTIVHSDPFASSPPPVQSPQTLSKPAVAPNNDECSDPFASSPKNAAPVFRSPRRSPLKTAHDNVSPTRDRGLDLISSSAPEHLSFRSSPALRKSRQVICLDESEQSGDSDGLPDIDDIDLSKAIAPPRRSALGRSRSEVIPRLAKSLPKKSAAEREQERKAKAATKEAEKEKKRQEREEMKKNKEQEKARAAALAEVNKIRTDKKISVAEMIVDLPAELSETVRTQVETLLDGLSVQHTTWENPMKNVVRWRRKITSYFDEDRGYWQPMPLRIDIEDHVLVIVTAEEFVDMAVGKELESHALQLEGLFPNRHIIYLLEGITPWMRKNRNIRNRQFTSRVRQDAEFASTRRRGNTLQEYISEDLIEDALLQLQVMHDVVIHHTTIPLETAQWITIFTQHISTIPYRRQKDKATLGAGFCMESGQVRTGDDSADTYVRMLQEIARVTAPIAYGIAAEFGSVTRLVNGLEKGGPLTLESVRKSANKDGAFSDRTIGQAVTNMEQSFQNNDEVYYDEITQSGHPYPPNWSQITRDLDIEVTRHFQKLVETQLREIMEEKDSQDRLMAEQDIMTIPKVRDIGAQLDVARGLVELGTDHYSPKVAGCIPNHELVMAVMLANDHVVPGAIEKSLRLLGYSALLNWPMKCNQTHGLVKKRAFVDLTNEDDDASLVSSMEDKESTEPIMASSSVAKKRKALGCPPTTGDVRDNPLPRTKRAKPAGNSGRNTEPAEGRRPTGFFTSWLYDSNTEV
ncbi:hypothetical protein S40288_08075 [Stachybotrys chartarum IBT 40288]|nr:hypothetical protein S40288_08075 [Stachybotrys chartarum IBT 40288]